MQGKLTVNTVALWAWYWLCRGGMVCLLWFMVKSTATHVLCIIVMIYVPTGVYIFCNLYPERFCQDIMCVHSRRFKWRPPPCSCWPTCVVSQRAYVLAIWRGGFHKQSQPDQVNPTWDVSERGWHIVFFEKEVPFLKMTLLWFQLKFLCCL